MLKARARTVREKSSRWRRGGRHRHRERSWCGARSDRGFQSSGGFGWKSALRASRRFAGAGGRPGALSDNGGLLVDAPSARSELRALDRA